VGRKGGAVSHGHRFTFPAQVSNGAGASAGALSAPSNVAPLSRSATCSRRHAKRRAKSRGISDTHSRPS